MEYNPKQNYRNTGTSYRRGNSPRGQNAFAQEMSQYDPVNDIRAIPANAEETVPTRSQFSPELPILDIKLPFSVRATMRLILTNIALVLNPHKRV